MVLWSLLQLEEEEEEEEEECSYSPATLHVDQVANFVSYILHALLKRDGYFNHANSCR